MGLRTDDPLPVLEPMPTGPQDIDFNSILEIADMGGVNDAMDRLVSQGVSPEQAAQMLQSAGFDLPSTAQPEQVGGYEENLPQGGGQSAPQEPETRRAEPVRRGATGSRMDLSFIQRINDPNLSEEQARAEYEKLPPALRYVYDRTADFSYNNQGSDTPAQLDPRDAAGWLDEFYQNQNRQAASQKEDKANKPLGPRELQVAMDDVALMRNTINSLRTHEGRSKALGIRGPMNMFAPSYIGGVVDKETGKQSPAAGTAAAGFSNLIDSSRAKVFIPVIQRMRGFGSMQVREAEAAVNSANRLSLELNNKDFESALGEVEDFADRFEARAKGVPVEEVKKQRGVATDQSSQAADNRPRKTLMGSKYAVNPDGTLEKVAK